MDRILNVYDKALCFIGRNLYNGMAIAGLIVLGCLALPFALAGFSFIALCFALS